MMDIGHQFGRFALIGAMATTTHILLAIVLVELVGLPPVSANFLAFCGALAVSYLGNHRWTFAANGRHEHHFPRFAIVALIGLALNQSIMYGTVVVAELDYRIGLAAIVILLPLLTFGLNRKWVF